MVEGDTKDILSAIEKQGERTANSIDKLVQPVSKLIGSVSQLTTAMEYGNSHFNGNSRSNGVWPIATISSVLLGLGVVFTSMATQQSKIGEMRNEHQEHVLKLMDGYQRERNEALDTLLQKEIEKEAQIVESVGNQSQLDSQQRHDEQQRQIDEIRGWFLTPKVRQNGGFNGGVVD